MEEASSQALFFIFHLQYPATLNFLTPGERTPCLLICLNHLSVAVSQMAFKLSSSKGWRNGRMNKVLAGQAGGHQIPSTHVTAGHGGMHL